MKKVLRKAAIVLSVIFLAIQVVRPEKKNPPVPAGKFIHEQAEMTPMVARILERACRDCHSNQTHWPWYSNVAPVSWWVIDHVNHGRTHLNLSNWGEYDAREKSELVEEICKQVSMGEMPLKPYPLMHREARLTKEDVRALCEWSESVQQKLARK